MTTTSRHPSQTSAGSTRATLVAPGGSWLSIRAPTLAAAHLRHELPQPRSQRHGLRLHFSKTGEALPGNRRAGRRLRDLQGAGAVHRPRTAGRHLGPKCLRVPDQAFQQPLGQRGRRVERFHGAGDGAGRFAFVLGPGAPATAAASVLLPRNSPHKGPRELSEPSSPSSAPSPSAWRSRRHPAWCEQPQ